MFLTGRRLHHIRRAVNHDNLVTAISPRHLAEPRLFPLLEHFAQLLKHFGRQRQLVRRGQDPNRAPPNAGQLKQAPADNASQHRGLTVLTTGRRNSRGMHKHIVAVVLGRVLEEEPLPRKQVSTKVRGRPRRYGMAVVIVPICRANQSRLISCNANSKRLDLRNFMTVLAVLGDTGERGRGGCVLFQKKIMRFVYSFSVYMFVSALLLQASFTVYIFGAASRVAWFTSAYKVL